MKPERLRVAIAHDYPTQRGGAERVVLAMARAFPDAPIYTTLFEPTLTFPEFSELDVRPSRLNQVPFFRRNHRAALPLLPFVSARLHVDADVVVASSSGWAHGFETNGRKLVYCYSPARWLYQQDRYLGDATPVVSGLLRLLSPSLRRWDRRSAATADTYLAISTAVKERIHDVYGLPARVVPAPLTLRDVDSPGDAEIAALPSAGYYLVVSRLLPYKNVRAIVDAFRLRSELRLVVVGTGPEKAELMDCAPGNVEFLENLTDASMGEIYARCVGLLAASHEDFGLTPLEAAARGKPSAVLRWGGFLDTMIEGETGTFFDDASPQSIAEAVDRLKGRSWDESVLRAHADMFSEERFAAALLEEVNRLAQVDGSGPRDEEGNS